MQAQWSHGDASYRCRFPEEYALANRIHHPRNVYLREKWITSTLDDWLTTVFQPHRLDDTLDHMAAAATPESCPTAQTTSAEAARALIADCDTKLATHRAALEAGPDPIVITQWIAETQATRARAEADLRTATRGTHPRRMTRDEIAHLVRSISELVAVIRQADPEDRAEFYRQLGLQLTYTPGNQTIHAEIAPTPHTPNNDKSPRLQRSRGDLVCVRGET
ncbi:hypothetical protein [Streptomyces sp. GS7]|uniref:hypothetical protein n=1 Tax=Streptomyces sp. GS7 TaxID=2692234 RepID=UPI0013179581|nr:hypothetical protein [Streptomyces sp. GS7]QHC24605.1 hypothetical protein GR130_27785 [Streptomyces sp. GS7]